MSVPGFNFIDSRNRNPKKNKLFSDIKRFFNSVTVITVLALLTTTTACRKDESEPEPPKPSPQVEITNNDVTLMNDATLYQGQEVIGVTESSINIPASGTIKDLSKMFVEINVIFLKKGVFTYEKRVFFLACRINRQCTFVL